MNKNNFLTSIKSKLIFFWIIVFLVNLGPEWHKFSSIREAIEVSSLATLLQWLVALISLRLLVPKLLNENRALLFCISLLIVLLVAAQAYILVSYFYLEPSYPNTYGEMYQTRLNDYSLAQRLGFSGLIKYIILSKIPMLFFPAAILIAADFYGKQKDLLELRQQKQAAELTALKHQLNPHFIFNTLNNIYSLAIQGSNATAEAIAKLSGIFDYVLYQCNDKFVSLAQEITMIKNYIALEKLRFGDRVTVTFSTDLNQQERVAPLLVLTLIENAFKHSVSQELKQATIDITLSETDKHIIFLVENSKPNSSKTPNQKQMIGIKNLQRQLSLLYPNRHKLTISDDVTSYSAQLKLGKHNDS